MTTTPWRIAAQSYVVLDPNTKEPALTMTFDLDHNRADICRLRITPNDVRAPAMEFEFATGGYATGEPVLQPRWLGAFERVDPNLHVDDSDRAEEYAASMSDTQREAYEKRRASYTKRRDDFNGHREVSVSVDAATQAG